MGDATGVDDDNIGATPGAGGLKAGLFENLMDLSAFVLVDFATERLY